MTGGAADAAAVAPGLMMMMMMFQEYAHVVYIPLQNSVFMNTQ